MLGGLVVGAVAANLVTKKAAEMLPAVGKYSGAIPAVLGWFLLGQKSAILKGAGAGMVAAGASHVIGAFVPMVAAPVSDSVLADAIINEEINAQELLPSVGDYMTSPIHEDMNEDLTEDLTEDLNEDLTEDMN